MSYAFKLLKPQQCTVNEDLCVGPTGVIVALGQFLSGDKAHCEPTSRDIVLAVAAHAAC